MQALAVRPVYSHVSPAAYLVLIRMCISAFDRDQPDQPARQYFAGHRPLAMALGYKIDDGDAPLGKTPEQAVTRAVKELIDTGLVQRYGTHWHQGVRNRAYLITF